MTILYSLISSTSPLVPTMQMPQEFFESNPHSNDPARQLLTKITQTANKTRSLDETLTAELLGDNSDKIAYPSKVEDPAQGIHDSINNAERRQCYSACNMCVLITDHIYDQVLQWRSIN